MTLRDYTERHWRGNSRLAWSYWVNGLLVLAVSLLLHLAILPSVRLVNEWPSLVITVVAADALLSGLIAAWQITGTWRSAQRHFVATGRRFWTHIAQATLIIAAAVAVFNVGRLCIEMYGYAKAAYGSYSLSDRGRGATELMFTGEVARPVPAAVERRLAANPAITVIVLEGGGGTEAAGWELRAVIAAHGLTTRTVTSCTQACFLGFMAGTERLIDPGAQLGYYQWPSRVNEAAEYQYLRSRNVSEDFIRHAQSVKAGTEWYPGLAELVAGHVVTAIRAGDHVEPAEQYCRTSGQC